MIGRFDWRKTAAVLTGAAAVFPWGKESRGMGMI